MKLHRDIGVSQVTLRGSLAATHRARRGKANKLFAGPVEIDETYWLGVQGQRSSTPRRSSGLRGGVGKARRSVRRIARSQQGQGQGRREHRREDPTEVRPALPMAQPSIRTTQRPTSACASSTMRAGPAKALVSTSGNDGPHQKDGIESFMPCSSGRTRASTTRSAPSTCNATLTNSGPPRRPRKDTLDQMQTVVAGMVDAG